MPKITRCPVTGKQVLKRTLVHHLVKSHPMAYPELAAHYHITRQSGEQIKRNTERKRRGRTKK